MLEVSHARFRRATVTPFASIIGSGFLMSEPLLARIAGQYAAVLLAGLCIVSYVISSAVRQNMFYVAPNIANGGDTSTSRVRAIELLSGLCRAGFFRVLCFSAGLDREKSASPLREM